jgi:MarR family transcriptional regulator, organic hydroperoxide resistance regulator
MVRATARDVRLYHRLQLAAHTVAKYSDQQLRDAVGLTTAQVAVLSVVAGAEEVSQREVARELGVNESAVTGMVARLERAGLLARSANERDRRAWILQLTIEGKAALRRAARAFTRVNEALEEALDPAEVADTAAHLDRIVQVVRGRQVGGSP